MFPPNQKLQQKSERFAEPDKNMGRETSPFYL